MLSVAVNAHLAPAPDRRLRDADGRVPAEELCRFCHHARTEPCPCANGNRLGGSLPVRGATRCVTESRLALRPCPAHAAGLAVRFNASSAVWCLASATRWT
jgi:hypothetical protein